jgi:hypothetical protein
MQAYVWAVSSVVEHFLDTGGVTGSNPVPPTIAAFIHRRSGGERMSPKYSYLLGVRSDSAVQQTIKPATPALTSAPRAMLPPGEATAPAREPASFATPTSTPVTIDNVVLPSAVSPKYSNEFLGKARMETCLVQYNANKANGGSGRLRRIENGAGPYTRYIKRWKAA